MLSSRPLFFHAKPGLHPMVAFILILFSFFLPSAPAADTHIPEKDTLPPVHSLGQIVVTAHGTEGSKGIAIDPTATSVVLGSYTSPRSPQTVKDVLESIPGVDIQRSDASLSNDKDVVKIRGMGARRIMVRIDGRPVRNAGGFSDRMVDWNSLTLENIERVEVVRGAHSAVYGEAIGGTVNIVTKKKGGKKGMTPEVAAMADYSGFETGYLRGNVSGNVKSVGYSIGAGYRSSDGYLKNSDHEIKDVTARLSGRLPFDGRLTLGYKGSFQDLSPYVVNDPDDPLVGHLYDSSYPVVPADAAGWTPNYPGKDSFFDKETQYWDLIFEQPTPVGKWKIHFYKSREYRDQSSYNYMQGPGFYDYTWDVTYNDWGWILQNRITISENHHVTFGFDGKINKLGYNAAMPGKSWDVPDNKLIEQRSGYLEDSWQMTEKLNLTLGVRYDDVDLDVDVDFPGYADFRENFNAWSPKSRLTYEFIPGTTGFIHVSKAFRVPTAMEFNWMGAPTGKYIEPETAMEYEGGIIQDLGKENSLRLTCYHYEIDDYIVLNRNPMPLLYAGKIEKTVFNADFLRLQGVEAELNFQLAGCLGGYLNYTYQHATLGDTKVPENELYDDHYQLPKHKASLGLDWSVFDGTTLMTNIRYVDKRKTSKDQELDRFVTLDLAVEQCLFGKKCKVKGYVTNLFDKDYEEQYHVPAPERAFGVHLSYLF
ncbi:MAG: TonB-dependent receptor [Desulfobacteraceae bacterium]|nr:TonB-dependent receptor [Desulfobacteraceae bacterium]